MTERFMLLFIKAISLRRFTGKHLECSFKKKKILSQFALWLLIQLLETTEH